jgi:hypothetical protein
MTPKADPEPRWLLLIHQIPPEPGYLRVKVARWLHRIGAVALKNTVYVLPRGDEGQEDFEWVLREIREGGGEATVCEARFVEGLRDEDVVALFNEARNADYRALADEARAAAELGHLRRRLEEIVALDFFRAPLRKAAESALSRLESRLRSDAPAVGGPRPEEYRGRTWVTRRGVHIDRMASAWLIRRFIDPDAKFLFVPGKGYEPRPGELRFDMFRGEFTHEGDRCTFEVLVQRLRLADPALRPIAEIVHDVDLKDGKFEREEAPGLDRLVAGICMAHKEDDERLARAFGVFDDLHRYFKRKRG